jgi:hypothetical protein
VLEDLDADETERAFTTTAIIEGRATVIEQAWAATNGVLPPLDTPEIPADIPPIYLANVAMPYLTGAGYVLANGGVAATNDAIENPPATTEEILVPTTPASEPEVEVPGPEADGPELARRTFGAVDLFYLTIGDAEFSPFRLLTAGPVADGWAGGEWVLWGDGRQSCLRLVVAAENPTEFDEIAATLGSWAGNAEGAETRQVEDGPADLTLQATGCGPFQP